VRLFVALEPPLAARAELDAALAPHRPDWPELRWAASDRWHVTLAFLGEVDDAVGDRLPARLERAAARHPRLTLSFGAAGAFPSPRRARVLCAHVSGERQALADLTALAASVAAGARRAGAPPPDEGRRFRPHVTVARSRHAADLAPLVRALAEFSGEEWTAEKVHLVRSYTGPQPRYETLASWPLRASA
jgi:RNA 2',3'-cyclic 3'-phosphodiesterase